MLIQLPVSFLSKIQIVPNEPTDCESEYHIIVTNVKKETPIFTRRHGVQVHALREFNERIRGCRSRRAAKRRTKL
jgi:hypothetical protein